MTHTHIIQVPYGLSSYIEDQEIRMRISLNLWREVK